MSISRGVHRSGDGGIGLVRRAGQILLRVGLIAGILWLVVMPVRSSTKLIDLDKDPNHTIESPISYTVTQISTTKVHLTDIVNSRVLNSTPYAFNWPTAGPGGFSSAISAPLVGDLDGVSVEWTWETDQSIVSQFCNSIDPTNPAHCIQFTPQPSGSPVLFPVQLGAKISSASVSPTSESLTSSLITIFSPPHELVRVTSDVRPLTSGEFQYRTQVQNLSGAPIVFDLAPGPLGCNFCSVGRHRLRREQLRRLRDGVRRGRALQRGELPSPVRRIRHQPVRRRVRQSRFRHEQLRRLRERVSHFRGWTHRRMLRRNVHCRVRK